MNDEPVWAIVELMGHVKLAGKLTEEEKFGVKMGRLDIPTDPEHPVDDCLACSGTGKVNGTPCPMSRCGPQYVTQLFGGGSVYRITIVTEAVARQVMMSHDPAPVSPWDFPKAIAGRTVTAAADGDWDTDQGNP